MGGCASSKYAVDEDKQQKDKKDKKPNNKKGKSKVVESAASGTSAAVTTARDATLNKSEQTVPKVEKEELEFIDKEDTEKQQAGAKAASKLDDDDVKKETTTYQTTVVKHTQKEGDELMQHLKDEAFKTLQNLLKQQQQNDQTTTTTMTASSSANTTPETSTTSNADPSSAENIVEQIKSQVNKSLSNDKKDLVNSIIDSGIELIRDNKVKNMGELQTALEGKFPSNAENTNNPELIKKVINATTGFLTAKGTEAGALLSSILANVSSGLQGVMNETEKTTVKVTRTVTEQLMSGGQINEITKVITRTEPTVTINPNINEILKDLTGSPGANLPTSPSKITTNTGNLSSTITSVITERLDSIPKDLLVTVEKTTVASPRAVAAEDELKTKQQAEQVVSTIVSAAVEKVQDETASSEETQLTNGHKEEEKVLTNGHDNHVDDKDAKEVKVNGSSETTAPETDVEKTATTIIEDVQSEFFKHGKKAAEEVVKKLTDLAESADAAVVVESTNETPKA